MLRDKRESFPTDTFINTDEIGTVPGLTLLQLRACFDPASPRCGKMLGYFRYPDYTTDTFFFVYNIRQPGGRPRQANKLESVDEVSMKTDKHGNPYLETCPTAFGRYAFWQGENEKTLESHEDSLALFRLAKALTAYSRQNRLCEKLRKLGRKRTEV